MSDDRRRRHERRKSSESAEIGELPPVADWGRRRACANSLALFGVTYFPDTVGKNLLCDGHFRCAERSEAALWRGGRVIKAVFRGFAKTTWSEIEALFGMLYGFRRYLVVVAAVKTSALEIFESIRSELEENDLLCEDFPEVCVPFRHLEGKSQRCASQTYQGERTHIAMKAGKLVLPSIALPPGWYGDGRGFDAHNPQSAASSGVILAASGFNPPTRGLKFKRADGTNARPDHYVFDDFQTDATARKQAQIRKIIDTYLYKSCFGSAGHGFKMSCSMNVTPIEPDDCVEELLDHERHPTFTGERIPMVISWATAHETLWQEYRKIRQNFDLGDSSGKDRAESAATAFYAANREEMDSGASVTWGHIPLDQGEISAIQHAYNKLFDSTPDAFASEFQMSPAHKRPEGVEPLTAADIAVRCNGYNKSEIPEAAAVVTVGVDVHDDLLYWLRVGFSQQCQGWILDYGTWPEQTSRYFSKRSATRTLKTLFAGKPPEEQVTLGLQALFAELSALDRVDKIIVDRGHKPNEVALAIRTATNPKLIQPALGLGIRADQIQIADYTQKPGYLLGDTWFKKEGIVSFDAYLLKTWLHQRWRVPITADGGLSLYGAPGRTDHRLLCEHLAAEVASIQEAERSGKKKVVWENSRRIDNHWLDCLVMASLGALMSGCSVLGPVAVPKTNRREQLLALAKQKLGG